MIALPFSFHWVIEGLPSITPIMNSSGLPAWHAIAKWSFPWIILTLLTRPWKCLPIRKNKSKEEQHDEEEAKRASWKNKWFQKLTGETFLISSGPTSIYLSKWTVSFAISVFLCQRQWYVMISDPFPPAFYWVKLKEQKETVSLNCLWSHTGSKGINRLVHIGGRSLSKLSRGCLEKIWLNLHQLILCKRRNFMEIYCAYSDRFLFSPGRRLDHF